LVSVLAATIPQPYVYYSCITVGVVTFTVVAGVLIHTVIKKNKLLKAQWFCVAIYCRAFNNKLALRSSLELRPGYHGLWIEIYELHSLKNYLENLIE
jgi:hypothetical protein